LFFLEILIGEVFYQKFRVIIRFSFQLFQSWVCSIDGSVVNSNSCTGGVRKFC